MAQIPLLLFLQLLPGFLLLSAVRASSPNERRLRRDLFSNYDKMVRWAHTPDTSTSVSLGLSFRSLIQLEERRHYMESVSEMIFLWNDPRLVWDRSEYGGVDRIQVPARDLWRPDIVPTTSIDEEIHLMETSAYVFCTGNVHWFPILRLRSPCIVNLEQFPFDEQSCSIKLSSYLSDGGEIEIYQPGHWSNHSISVDNFQPNPDWKLVNYSSQITHHDFWCCNETYPVVEINVSFRRKSQHYLQLLVIPALVLGALVPLSLLLPPDCKERITVEAIVILSILLLLSKMYDVIPLTQGKMPALARYYITTLLLDVMAIFGSTVILNLHNRAPRRTKVPEVIKGLLLGSLRWVACLSGDTYLPLDDVDSFSMRGLNKTMAAQPQSPPNPDFRGANSTKMEDEVAELGKTVSALSTRCSRKDTQEEILNEWQQVALILDRLLFLLLLLLSCVCSLSILG